jgi:hypothetical protein
MHLCKRVHIFSFEESFTCRWSHEECQLRTTVAVWQFNSISPKMVRRKESPLKMFAPLLERFSNFGPINHYFKTNSPLIYLSEEYIVFACKVVEVTSGGNFVRLRTCSFWINALHASVNIFKYNTLSVQGGDPTKNLFKVQSPICSSVNIPPLKIPMHI